LIEKRIFEARQHRGWRRHRALVALGRTRAPEGIRALAEGLRDTPYGNAPRGAARPGTNGLPEAAEEILAWVGEAGLNVPPLPLQSALIQCTAERPQLLLPLSAPRRRPCARGARASSRRVASPSLGMDLLQFAEDDLDELRAAAARGLSHTQSGLALGA